MMPEIVLSAGKVADERGRQVTVAEQKRRAAEAALKHVTDGMTLGVGTGSTVDIFIDLLAEKVAAEKLSIRTLSSSYGTSHRLRAAGLAVDCLGSVATVSLTVDGADEVDPQLALIKGGGGAFLREKILAEAAEQLVIIVDQSKLVKQLGTKSPVPVEVLPVALASATLRINQLGGSPMLRQGEGKAGPVITDNGNFVLDVKFPKIGDPAGLDLRLKAIPGVLETGLFPDQANIVYVGSERGVTRLARQSETRK
jgi:ribose 5-phosphate isomerase A